jgi:outer membrane biosynthesis protein TonB
MCSSFSFCCLIRFPILVPIFFFLFFCFSPSSQNSKAAPSGNFSSLCPLLLNDSETFLVFCLAFSVPEKPVISVAPQVPEIKKEEIKQPELKKVEEKVLLPPVVVAEKPTEKPVEKITTAPLPAPAAPEEESDNEEQEEAPVTKAKGKNKAKKTKAKAKAPNRGKRKKPSVYVVFSFSLSLLLEFFPHF